jgi:hypothetical protein
MAGNGKIVVGIVLIFFGIGGAGYGLWEYTIQHNNIQTCDTFLGALSQLDSSNASVCKNAPQSLSVAIVSGLTGAVMTVIGIITISFGISQKSK